MAFEENRCRGWRTNYSPRSSVFLKEKHDGLLYLIVIIRSLHRSATNGQGGVVLWCVVFSWTYKSVMLWCVACSTNCCVSQFDWTLLLLHSPAPWFGEQEGAALVRWVQDPSEIKIRQRHKVTKWSRPPSCSGPIVRISSWIKPETQQQICEPYYAAFLSCNESHLRLNTPVVLSKAIIIILRFPTCNFLWWHLCSGGQTIRMTIIWEQFCLMSPRTRRRFPKYNKTWKLPEHPGTNFWYNKQVRFTQSETTQLKSYTCLALREPETLKVL